MDRVFFFLFKNGNLNTLIRSKSDFGKSYINNVGMLFWSQMMSECARGFIRRNVPPSLQWAVSVSLPYDGGSILI